MSVLLEETGVYRGGSVGRPHKCRAKLYADRIEVTSFEGAELGTFPLSAVTRAKASGAGLMLKGDTFKSASIEFMSTGRKLLLAFLGVIPLVIAMYVGQGRKTAVAWTSKIEELRQLPPATTRDGVGQGEV